jgi:hypothetical protein
MLVSFLIAANDFPNNITVKTLIYQVQPAYPADRTGRKSARKNAAGGEPAAPC